MDQCQGIKYNFRFELDSKNGFTDIFLNAMVHQSIKPDLEELHRELSKP